MWFLLLGTRRRRRRRRGNEKRSLQVKRKDQIIWQMKPEQGTRHLKEEEFQKEVSSPQGSFGDMTRQEGDLGQGTVE